MDLLIKNMDNYTNPYCLDDYIVTVSKWAKKYKNEPGWQQIEQFILEGVFSGLGQVISNNYAFSAVGENEKKFAYAFEIDNGYQYDYSFGASQKNAENLKRTLAGFALFETGVFNGKTFINIKDVVIRPDLQNKNIFENSFSQMFANPELYFGFKPNLIATKINSKNTASRKSFNKIGLDTSIDSLNKGKLIHAYISSFDEIQNKCLENLEMQKSAENIEKQPQ